MLRGCRSCRATSPFSLSRAYLIGRPAVCCGVGLPVCPLCRVVLRSPRARHAQLVADKSLASRSVRHARLPHIKRMLYEETAPVEFQLIKATMRKNAYVTLPRIARENSSRIASCYSNCITSLLIVR